MADKQDSIFGFTCEELAELAEFDSQIDAEFELALSKGNIVDYLDDNLDAGLDDVARDYLLDSEELEKRNRTRRYYLANRDRILAAQAVYRLLHLEEIRRYREDHVEQIRKYQRVYQAEYYQKNREYIKEYSRRYYQEHKEQHNDWRREYRLKNKEKVRVSRRLYYLEHKNEIIEKQRRRRAKKRLMADD